MTGENAGMTGENAGIARIKLGNGGDMEMTPYITFDITKTYGDFSLSCRGEFSDGVTAVFGPSGSGKTTLLDSIAGMVSPDSGEIRVGGRLIYSSADGVDLPPEKRRFGYVFQDGALFPSMSVRENIEYGFRLTPQSERQADPDALADLLGVRRLMERGVSGLSGGERQRVALARALAVSPRLLLLDEPLASLDAAYRGSILRHLKGVSDSLRVPMIFVSHSLSEVLALAPRVLALDGGSAVAYGRTPEILAHPAVARVADYGTLENILEAEVAESADGESASALRVGDATLIAPPTAARPGDRVSVSIRAGEIILSLGALPMTSARNAVPAVIRELRPAGGRTLVYADMGAPMVVEITPASAAAMNLKAGQDIYLIIKSNSVLTL